MIYDTEAEEQVAGTAIATKDGFARALALCSPADFYTPALSRLFRAAPVVWASANEPFPGSDDLEALLAWDPQGQRNRQAAQLAAMDEPEVYRVVEAALWQPERFARRVAHVAGRRRAAAALEDALARLRDGEELEAVHGDVLDALAP